jgi:hypothetical protein
MKDKLNKLIRQDKDKFVLFSIDIINLTTPFNERAQITEAIKLSRFTEAKKLVELHESYTKRYLMSSDVRKHEEIGCSLDTIEDVITLIEGVCAGKSDGWCVDWAYDLASDFNSELINAALDEIIKPSTVDRACKLLRGRANVGEVKYGVTIDRDDLSASDWAQHALEEMLDGAQYLIRLKDEMEALQRENAELKQELKHNQKQELTNE